MTDFDTREKIQANLEASPFNSFCGFRAECLDKAAGRLVMTMPMRPEMERIGGSGQMHGGPVACLIDTAGCYASMMMIGHGVPTINFRTDYLRPAVNTNLKAVATVRHAGRTVSVTDVDVFDDRGKLVATGRGTYSSKSG